MTVGFRVRNNITGEVTVEITDRLTRVIGTVHVTTAPGSFVIPGNNGTAFFYLSSDGLGTRIPAVTQNGRTLSWPALDASFDNPNQVEFWVTYGEF